jgi:hypothetical protein
LQDDRWSGASDDLKIQQQGLFRGVSQIQLHHSGKSGSVLAVDLP